MLRQWTTTTRRNFGCFYLSTYCFFFIRGFSTCTTIAWPWNYCFCFVRRKQGVDINLRSDAATSSMGGGLTPCVMTLTNHNRLTNSFIKTIDHTWRHTLLRIVNVNYRAAAHQLRKLKLEGEDVSQVLDIAVSLEADWQKRYGLNSLKGITFVISIDTGCILNYIVKTKKQCQECKSNCNATEEWKEKHEKTCCINHIRNSGVMEADGVIQMFLNSSDMRNLKYTTYVGDGNSNSFGCVFETLEK